MDWLLWCRRSTPSSSGRLRRFVVLLCVALTVSGVIYLGYFCPERVCALSTSNVLEQDINNSGRSDRLQQSSSKTIDRYMMQYSEHGDEEDIVDRPQTKVNQIKIDNSLIKPRSDRGTLSVSFDEIVNSSKTSDSETSQFNIGGSDVIVFLHIQKTGGTTFGRHLVHDLDLEKPCQCTSSSGNVINNKRHGNNNKLQQQQQQRKRCRCIRPNSDTSGWLFSRFSTGWQCGLHADWTELNGCVDSALDREERASSSNNADTNRQPVDGDNDAALIDDEQPDSEIQRVASDLGVDDSPHVTGRHQRRRYFYVTLLREPLVRFLSEFLHVQRGATWKTARHWCGGREATRHELPNCYDGDDWEDVSLDEFMSCPSNLAINRQTRMLADLSLIGCYNASAMSTRRRDAIMLASAKDNLRRLAFYGLCEQQQMAQYMFEETFHMNFLTTFQQLNETHVTSALAEVTREQLRRLKRLNYLDVQLYEYAKQLLGERFGAMKHRDPDFEAHYRGLRPAGLTKGSAAALKPIAPLVKYLPWEESDSN